MEHTFFQICAFSQNHHLHVWISGSDDNKQLACPRIRLPSFRSEA
jgi:hypothetical protein